MNNICPITGQHCSMPKCIHVTDIGPDYNATHTVSLCVVCGGDNFKQNQPMGHTKNPTMPLPPQFESFFDFLKYIMENKPVGKVVLGGPQAKAPCPACGWSIHDIAKQARLGCPHCYDHYGPELTPVLLRSHKALKHVGKRPKHHQQKQESAEELEKKLAQAVKEERYEDAIEIKKAITKLRDH